MERVTLTAREQRRLLILNDVERGHLTIREAAGLLNVSERQVRRVLAAYRKEGAEALAHGNRGRVPVNTVDDATRARIVELARTTYAGFNCVHMSEQLVEREKITISRSTLRRLLMEAGIPGARTRRAPTHRSRRDRYPRRGMLLQMDGSLHAWLEDRGPVMTLIAGIDDATNIVEGAMFREREDAAGYLHMLSQVVQSQGCPLAVYHDRHGIFGITQVPDDRYPLLGLKRNEPTQVERALEDLSIRSIPARSPQAKGRVERLFGTLQDRLVSEMRLEGIDTLEGANAYLQRFLPRFNDRFAVPPAQEGSAYRLPPDHLALDGVFAFRYLRTVGADNTVRLGEHRLQLLPSQERRHFAKCRVEVAEHLDGRVTVQYQGVVIGTKEAPEEAPRLRARGGPRPPSRTPEGTRTAEDAQGKGTSSRPSERRRNPPSPSHPWRRS